MGAGLGSGMKGGRKLKRSPKDRTYYERQHTKTAMSKARRAAKRRTKAEYWKTVRAEVNDGFKLRGKIRRENKRDKARAEQALAV